MAQMEQLELDAHRGQLGADVQALVERYRSIFEWDIPEIDQGPFRSLDPEGHTRRAERRRENARHRGRVMTEPFGGQDVIETAQALMASDKGLLAMDESNPTCNQRFAALGIPQTAAARRAWRELIVTTPGLADSISGAILFEETIHQRLQDGRPFQAWRWPRSVTEGLDGLRERQAGYSELGARFAKWRVVFRDIEAKLPLGNAREMPGLDELLQTADVVSLHVPETAETVNMIGPTQLAAMKPGSHLINASRGTLVDIGALVSALESRHLHGAAIDVFPLEPQGSDSAFVSPLTRFDNAMLTPHIGGSISEAQVNIGKEVASKLIRYSNNGSTTSAVNFPEVALPEHSGRSRLLRIQKNVPGVLAQVNQKLSAVGINIAAQYLSTNADVGYVVIDNDHVATPPAPAEASPPTVQNLGPGTQHPIMEPQPASGIRHAACSIRQPRPAPGARQEQTPPISAEAWGRHQRQQQGSRQPATPQPKTVATMPVPTEVFIISSSFCHGFATLQTLRGWCKQSQSGSRSPSLAMKSRAVSA